MDKACIENVLSYYYLVTKLKYLIRTGWKSDHWNINSLRLESVAEHVYGTCMIAIAMYSEYQYNIDISKVVMMLAIHEVGEAIIGDITPHQNISREEKIKLEHEAVYRIFSPLLNGQKLYELMLEFDEHKTEESKFAYHIDKLEANLQSKYYQDMGFHNPMDKQDNNIIFKKERTQELIKNGASTPFDIWYNNDIELFSDNNFRNIMDYLKEEDVSKFVK